ncbi:hypothetical protein [Okeania sp. SIO1I7]|uniref:hypothetical protein n=1 Tax=Okeania sp. SIO1I7 TaxID=2607772 RepID=UPI0025D43C42|nr:hypothetical protein [Okeania sp. SIO1I7]
MEAALQKSGFRRMNVAVGGWDLSNTAMKSCFLVQPVLVTTIVTVFSVTSSPCNVSITG